MDMGNLIGGDKLTIHWDSYADILDNNFTPGADTYSGDDTNSNAPCSFDTPREFDKIFLPIFYTIIFLLGLSGNLLVIVVLQRYKQGLASTDTFILHLAIADILLVLTLPFWGVQAVSGWVFGTTLCKAIGSAFTINFYCGIFLLVCISFDRYLSIVHAIHMYKKHKTRMAHFSSLSVWGFSLLLTIPDLVFLEVVKDGRQNTTECLLNFHSDTAQYWRTSMRFIYHVVGFFLPLLLMLYCYIMITRTLLGSQGFQKHKAMRVIVAVVVAFFLCWAPYNLAVLTDSFLRLGALAQSCELESQIDIGISVTSTLGYFHCCLNPLLYAFVGVKFRNSFLDLLRHIGCINNELMKTFSKPQSRNSNWSESGDTSYSGI